MTRYYESNREYKGEIRAPVIDHFKKEIDGFPAHLLVLPGIGWMWEKGLKEQDQDIVCIHGWEKSHDIFHAVRVTAPKNVGACTIRGDIVEFLRMDHPTKDENLYRKKYNGIYLDFCGEIVPSMVEGLGRLHHKLTADDERVPFAITFQMWNRFPEMNKRFSKNRLIKQGPEGKPASDAARRQMWEVRKALHSRANRTAGWKYKHVGQFTYSQPAPAMCTMWGTLVHG